MTDRTRNMAFALVAMSSLVACHSASQAPGMNANELSDDRGAGAGHFRSPANDAADANDTGLADNSVTTKGNQ